MEDLRLFVVEGGDGDDLAEAPLAQVRIGGLREREGFEALCHAGLRGREGLVKGRGLRRLRRGLRGLRRLRRLRGLGGGVVHDLRFKDFARVGDHRPEVLGTVDHAHERFGRALTGNLGDRAGT